LDRRLVERRQLVLQEVFRGVLERRLLVRGLLERRLLERRQLVG
jgi:hypothetical protein